MSLMIRQTGVPSLYTWRIFLSMIFGDILKEFCPISGYTKRVLVEGKLLPFYVTLSERDSAPQHVLQAHPSMGTILCLSTSSVLHRVALLKQGQFFGGGGGVIACHVFAVTGREAELLAFRG